MVSEKDSTVNYSRYFVTVIFLFLTAVLYFRRNKKSSRFPNLPPGPVPYPMVGNALQVGMQPHLTFMKWADIYGAIIHLKMLSEDMVILNDPKMIKEIFSLPETSGRNGDSPIFHQVSQGPYGIINTDGDTWVEQRRFTIRTLRDFGFAKAAMEGIIMEELRVALNWLKERQGKPTSGNRIFPAPVANTLWTIVKGERNEWENGDSGFIVKGENLITSFMEVASKGVYYIPWLRLVLPNWSGWNRFTKSITEMRTCFIKAVDEHKTNFDGSSHYTKDYIDHYLKEIKNADDSNSNFYGDTGLKNLIANVFDIIMAGSETTSTALSWGLLYLSRLEPIQKRMQEEIDRVIGSSSPPTLSARGQMPFTEAVMLEVQRAASIAPLGVPHRVMADFEYQGYSIKKDTAIMANLHGVHHDPKIWGDPEAFRPERFLNAEGTKVIKHEALMPFSEGKRKCLGESLARDTNFLYLTSIFQQFDVLPECKAETFGKADFEGEVGGFFNTPKPFTVVFSPRTVIGSK